MIFTSIRIFLKLSLNHLKSFVAIKSYGGISNHKILK
ncbi:Hypothetical protein HPV225_1599 [Helicobacter pylori v225d]|nr:Hypothetical protein HPV225_1599 [Helicobacter pylori v225d]